MSERSPEAERVDESVVDGADASAGTEDSHAADVAAGFDDADDAPVQPSSEEDGSF